MIRLTLPLPPNRANAREHWQVTHRKKKEYYLLVAVRLGEQSEALRRETGHGLPRFEAKRMRLDATLYVWAKMDKGNLVARLKWLEDALVMYGLLVDDNEEWLDLQMPKQVVDRKNRRVEITLEEQQ